MGQTNVLLLCGGGGSEHQISLISAKHIYNSLSHIPNINIFQVEICKNGDRIDREGNQCEMRKSGEIFFPHNKESHTIHFAIPCIHGPPGENGEIQSIFEQMNLPYLGSSSEPSQLCFNKVSTKLWFDALDIPNTPSIFLWKNEASDLKDAHDFLKDHGQVFVKASSQGSSIGCFKVTEENKLADCITEAFKLSPYVLIEKGVQARELEISVYEYKGELIATHPGEIICPDGFYSYEEKYADVSHTQTVNKATDLSEQIIVELKYYALKAFRALKLKDLARIDFFVTKDQQIFLNEINTFPGMTPISMFPKMMEENGDDFTEFLKEKIESRRRKD